MEKMFAKTLILIVMALQGCNQEKQAFEMTNCDLLPEGWVDAESVSPDLVPPCNKGSVGTCEEFGYEYVTGTGYCRPR